MTMAQEKRCGTQPSLHSRAGWGHRDWTAHAVDAPPLATYQKANSDFSFGLPCSLEVILSCKRPKSMVADARLHGAG